VATGVAVLVYLGMVGAWGTAYLHRGSLLPQGLNALFSAICLPNSFCKGNNLSFG